MLKAKPYEKNNSPAMVNHSWDDTWHIEFSKITPDFYPPRDATDPFGSGTNETKN